MKAFKIILALILVLTCSTVNATQLRRVDIKKIEAQVSADNSSVATLGGGITFNGASVDALNYGSISVAVSTDVASSTDGLVISQGVDGVNFPFTDSYSIAAGANKPFLVNRVARYVKVDYTNGAAPQGSFFLSTILNPFHVPGSSHKIKDDILNDDDAPVNISVLKVQTNDENTYKNVDVQNPLPSDGDSVYAKDLDIDNSDIGTFTGDIETLFNDYQTEITDTTATNPKTFTIHFRRPVTTSSFGMGSLTGDFSNVKIELKDLAGTARLTVDDTANSTKFTSNVYNFAPITFIEAVVEFHTADAVKISGAFIPKDSPVVARIQAVSDFTGNVESVNSFRGALNVNEALVHKTGISTLFHRTNGTSTTLAAAITAGDTSITVTSAVGFSIGDKIQVATNIATGEYFFTITNIVAAVITLDMPVPTDVDNGNAVDKILTNMSATAGTLGAPVSYTIHPPAGSIWQITRILISITDGTTMDDGKFGGIAALTNGVVLRSTQDGIISNTTNWKTNGEMALDMFDIEYTTKAPAGANGLRGRWTFTKGEFIVELNGDDGDIFEFLIQDDGTANTSFDVKAQGRLFGG